MQTTAARPPYGAYAAIMGVFSTRMTDVVITAWFAAIALWATLSPSIRAAPKLSELAEAA